jgi:hypothetical protein
METWDQSCIYKKAQKKAVLVEYSIVTVKILLMFSVS